MRTLLPVLLLSSQIALAQPATPTPYAPFDIRTALVPPDQASGRAASLDVVKLDAEIDQLALHARSYPTRFASEADKQSATRDATVLMGVLDVLNRGDKPSTLFLRRAAIVDSMAHNLDVPGAAPKAADYFSRWLAIEPDDPQGNFLFGGFLGGAGKPDAALAYLQKADSLGVVDASFALGSTYLMLGDKDKAIANLERYRRLAPGDKSVDPLLEAIRAGRFEAKHTQ